MQLFHLYHHHQLHKLHLTGFWLFELSIWLHVIARSLITIFIPVLLLQIGYSLQEVMLFFVLQHFIDIPLNFFARWLTYKIGARWVIITGTVFIVLFYAFFANLGFGDWGIIVLLAVLLALYDALYWVAHLYLFIESTKEPKDSGRSTGILYAVKYLARLLGPAVGAMIIVFTSSNVLIYVSIVIFLLSIIPLLKIKDFKDKPDKPPLPIGEFFKDVRERKNYTSSVLFSIHGAIEGIMWPLFIYAVFESITSVALLPIIVSVTSIVFSVLVGRVSKKQRDNFIIVGAVAIALVWIARIFWQVEFFYFFSVFLIGLFTLFVAIPIDSNVFRRSKELDPLSGSMYRNALHMGVKAFMFLGFYFALDLFNISFITSIAALLVLASINYLFIRKYKCNDIICTVWQKV